LKNRYQHKASEHPIQASRTIFKKYFAEIADCYKNKSVLD